MTQPCKGHFSITDVDDQTGEPLQPAKNAKKYVHQCGALVRDRLSINIRKWKRRMEAPHISYVSDRDKELLWKEAIEHFGLPPCLSEQQIQLVRSWTLKKMADLF